MSAAFYIVTADLDNATKRKRHHQAVQEANLLSDDTPVLVFNIEDARDSPLFTCPDPGMERKGTTSDIERKRRLSDSRHSLNEVSRHR